MNETKTQVGQIRTEVHGHVFKIIIDNVAKKNSFSPQMMAQMSDAMTLLDRTDDYWVGVLCAEGPDFTAGLDMPKFFGPKAENTEIKPGNIDAFALKSRCRKPIVTAVQGICFTIGIEMMLAGDIVVAADDARFCQMESKRGIAPLGGAHFRYLTRAGWGDAMYHLFLCDEFNAARAHKIGFVQEVVAPGQQIARAMEIAYLIAKNAPIGIQVTKEAALKYIEAGERAAIDYIPKIKDRVFSSEDMKEGIQSFVERRSGSVPRKIEFPLDARNRAAERRPQEELTMGSIKKAFDLTGKNALVTGGSRGLGLDVVIARLVDRSDPATHLGGGSLQQRQAVGAERDGKIFKPALLLSREARGQIGLMLAENVDREQSSFPDGRSCRAAFARAEQQHARLQRHRRQRVDRRAEQLALPLGRDDGDPGRKSSHDRPEMPGIMACRVESSFGRLALEKMISACSCHHPVGPMSAVTTLLRSLTFASCDS